MVKLYFMVSNPIWDYYLNELNINDNNYLFEFDVVCRHNGENHYRVQRLEKIYEQKRKSSTGKIPQSTSVADNIPQSNNNVKSSILPTINNTQNI